MQAGESIGRRVAKGAAWMVGMRLGLRIIGLISTVILARILVPADFGLVALATTLLGALEVLSQFSFDVALIRERNADRSSYDTVWTLNIARGVLLALLLAAAAHPMALFFAEPRVEAIAYVLAACVAVEGLQNVGVVDFRKKLDFRRDFLFLLAQKLVAFSVTIALAFLWRDYWALVVGIAAGYLAGLALSYLMHPFRPRLSLAQWRPMLGFSQWMLGINIIMFVGNRMDTFVVGRLLGTHTLGLYSVAVELASLASSELVMPIQRALFPGYAAFIDDEQQMKSAYLRGLALMLVLAMPIAAGLPVVAEHAVALLLGPKWQAVVPLLQILSVSALLRLGYANSVVLLMARGELRLTAGLLLAVSGFQVAVLIAMTAQWGILGAVWSLGLGALFGFLAHVGTIAVRLRIGVSELAAVLWRTIAAAAAMAVAVHALAAALPPGSMLETLVSFSLLVLFGAAIYTLTLLALWLAARTPRGAEADIIALLLPRLAPMALAAGLRAKP